MKSDIVKPMRCTVFIHRVAFPAPAGHRARRPFPTILVKPFPNPSLLAVSN